MTLASRDKAFFLLALLGRGTQAQSLLTYVPQATSEMQKLFQPLAARREKEMKAVARVELRKMAHPQNAGYLAEVHDDWLADFLLGETALVISVLLRQLPADRVAGVLSRLPKEVADGLPRLSDTYAVPKRLGELLQSRFEARFAAPVPSLPETHNPIALLAGLRAAQIQSFFLELGYREIAIGLGSLPSEAREMVMGRLGAEDRQKVEQFMAEGRELPVQRLRRAQMHLVSKEMDPNRPEKFVRSLGNLLFAKAVLPSDKADFRVLTIKMAHAESRELMVRINEGLVKNNDASVIPYREDLMTALRAVMTAHATH